MFTFVYKNVFCFNKTHLTSNFYILEYYISIYITDLVRFKTYRTYEIFKCKIPTSYSERWLLLKLANVGLLLEKLLTDRKSIKEKMCEEDSITENNRDSVSNWITIPENTPEKKKPAKK